MAFTENRTTAPILIPSPRDLVRAMHKWSRRKQKRREIMTLLQQDEWVLKDMGITRDDVREALAYGGDPSLHLRALAARRRYWARKSVRI